VATDVLGFNYFLQHHIDEMHARFPLKPIVGTEESSSEHTRGIYADDLAHQHLVAYDFEADGHHASVEDSWKFYLARPYAAGLFYWTGFDYRGETTPFGWPAISSQFGMLDTCGFFKDNAYLLQSWWTAKPMVHLLPHWNWPGQEARPINVRVYSNADAIELLLNGKSLGRKPMPRNSHLEWTVDYQPGTLVARGFDADGKEVASDVVATTGPAAVVQLIPNQEKIMADGESVSVVTVRVNDANGRMVPIADNLVSFSVSGPGKIIGVGNGDPASHEPDKYIETVQSVSPVSTTHRGRKPVTLAGTSIASTRRPVSFAASSSCRRAQGTRPSPWCCAAWERRSPSMSMATHSESTWPAIPLVTPTNWTGMCWCRAAT
jgi:beta-galactosidase